MTPTTQLHKPAVQVETHSNTAEQHSCSMGILSNNSSAAVEVVEVLMAGLDQMGRLGSNNSLGRGSILRVVVDEEEAVWAVYGVDFFRYELYFLIKEIYCPFGTVVLPWVLCIRKWKWGGRREYP